MPKSSYACVAVAAFFLFTAGAAHAQSGQLVGLGNKCVDVFNSGTDAGTPVVLWECTGNPNQQWSFQEVQNFPIDQFFLYEIVGLGGQCLRPGPVGDSGFPEIEMGPCGTSESEWGTSNLNGEFKLIHEPTQLCLDVLGSDTDNGTPMIAFECRDQANQLFRLLSGGDLPAYFVPAQNTRSAQTPCVVYFDGLDITKEIQFMRGVPDLIKRGIAVLVVDGPGTGEAIRFRGMHLRYDYETAGSACLDWLATRDDIDQARIGIVAISLGGYYAPRCAALD
ncbi:MAG: RICIN domain-containing protein, partial [Acidobacteriota bacterium]